MERCRQEQRGESGLRQGASKGPGGDPQSGAQADGDARAFRHRAGERAGPCSAGPLVNRGNVADRTPASPTGPPSWTSPPSPRRDSPSRSSPAPNGRCGWRGSRAAWNAYREFRSGPRGLGGVRDKRARRGFGSRHPVVPRRRPATIRASPWHKIASVWRCDGMVSRRRRPRRCRRSADKQGPRAGLCGADLDPVRPRSESGMLPAPAVAPASSEPRGGSATGGGGCRRRRRARYGSTSSGDTHALHRGARRSRVGAFYGLCRLAQYDGLDEPTGVADRESTTSGTAGVLYCRRRIISPPNTGSSYKATSAPHRETETRC